jgi:mRNA-degrading endonuclease RelE of RelBE toxin-antitoxin system
MKERPPRAIEYGLELSTEIERRLARCRASIRKAIRSRLDEIVVAAGKAKKASGGPARNEPPLRFYAYDGYRVLYQVDAGTRRVVVLDVGPATSSSA